MAGGSVIMSTNNTKMINLVDDYIASRRKLGFEICTQAKELQLFARYCDTSGHRGPITTDLAISWARLPQKADPIYWAYRLDAVRRFARYRAVFEPETEIPPMGILGSSKRRPTPHIYSEDEIGLFLQAASKLKPIDGLKPHTYVTLFGLLVCTGMRISEALRLTDENIDFENGIITIERTKFNKSRMIPIHSSTVKRLKCYWEKKQKYYMLSTCKNVFINDHAIPINYQMALWIFLKIRKSLKWKKTENGRSPTIHCFRHTFAVQRLIRWYEEGADVNQKILSLSTYLGHVEVTDTYWYLTAVPQLLSICAARFKTFTKQQGDK